MKNPISYIIFVAFFYCSDAFSQDDSTKVSILVRIIDASNHKPIYNAQSISYKTMLSFATDTDGILNFSFDIDDSIKVFGLGYNPITIHSKEFLDIDSIATISLTRKTYMIKEVDVKTNEFNLHLPNDIKLGKHDDLPAIPLRGDDYNSAPSVVDAIFSPVSVAHYYTSKKEKRKREFRKLLNEETQQDKISNIYNAEIIKEVSEYEGDTLNKFIVYCNVHLNIAPHTNPIIVKQMIADLKPVFEQKLNKDD